MLAKLDEYGAVLDTTKVDTQRTWGVMLPRLIHNAQQMEVTFRLVDELELYVYNAGEAMKRLEHRVGAMEEEVTGGDSVQSKVMSFFKQAKPTRDPVLDEPVDYIPKASEFKARLAHHKNSTT